MSLDPGLLDSFVELAAALGMLDANHDVNTAWFSDPVGASTANARGLRTMLAIDDQRESLLAFVDELLGAPDREAMDGAVWLPLLTEGSVTVSAVVDTASTDAVLVGVGVEHTTAPGAVTVTTRAHVMVFRATRSGHAAPVGDPTWAAIGQPGGRIGLSIDATFGVPPASGVAIGGMALTLSVPTNSTEALVVALELRDVVLPGAAAPRTFVLDAASLDELGRDTFDLLVSLLHAQADALDPTDAALRPFTALCGVLGLRTVAGLPALPLDALPTLGMGALVSWIDDVLADAVARDVWLGELAGLLGGTVDAANDAVCITAGPVRVCIGLRVAAGVGGHLVLTPWIDASFETGTGALVQVVADLFAADLGTGTVSAVPAFRAEAVFGADAGGGALLAGDPSVGSAHVGFVLDATRRPALALTLHDVSLDGATHDVLDLSSPDAVLDAASDVVGSALVDALSTLGPGGSLISTIIGLAPPAGVSAINPALILSDPLGALATYWDDLVTSAAGLPTVLEAVSALITGVSAAVPGSGTPADPWRIELPVGVTLTVTLDGRVLEVAARVERSLTVFTDHPLDAMVAVTLVRIDIARRSAAFLTGVAGTLTLQGPNSGPLVLDTPGIGLSAAELSIIGAWQPGIGLTVDLAAPDLALTVDSPGPNAPQRITVPLPRRVAGRLVFDPSDWTSVEAALGVLLADLGLPAADSLVEWTGWATGGPRLSLGELLTGDPALAVSRWLPDRLLDCALLRDAMWPIVSLLAGFTASRPFGMGTDTSPYLAPIAAHRLAPGVAAWLEPGCPPSSDRLATLTAGGGSYATIDGVMAALESAAETLADVADLLVARPGIGGGLTALIDRWVGTDGVVGAPVTMPSDIAVTVLDGYAYDDLVAYANQGWLLADVLASSPTAVVYIGCEESMLADRPAGTIFDLSQPVAGATTVPTTGAGTWYVRIPTPPDAAVYRPDRGAVGEQASRLVSLLSERTDPIVVVAHGAAGAAAIRAATDVASITDVVTVGTPWAPLSVEALRVDALRFVGALEPSPAPPWPEDVAALQTTPGHQVRGVIARSMALAAPGDPALLLPSADAEVRRAGLTVSAAFGSAAQDTLIAGLAALADDAVRTRVELAEMQPEPVHNSLHAGVQLPVIDLDLGGLTIGGGVIIELCSLARADTITGLQASARRRLIIDVRFGVTDGWLVGGPGATSDELELRWMSARVAVPLGSGPPDPADIEAELVLHDARGFDAVRQRWVVRAGADGISATVAVPEVRVLLSAVVARLGGPAPAVVDVLEAIGLVVDGGIDPESLDRLLHDPVLVARGANLGDLASALRALIPSAIGEGSVVSFTADTATVIVDLAAGSVTADLSRPSVGGYPAVEGSFTAAAGSVALDLAIGTISPDAGGLRLLTSIGGTAAPSLAVEWASAGGVVPRRLSLLPFTSIDDATDLLTTLVPAAGARALARAVRRRATGTASVAFDAFLTATGLLSTDGTADVVLPLALFDDPGQWLRHGVSAWRADPSAAAAALIDAIAPLISTGPSVGTSWPLGAGASLTRTIATGLLTATIVSDHEVTVGSGVDSTDVAVRLDGGLSIGANGAPIPSLTASVMFGTAGLRITLQPTLTIELVRTPPASGLRIHPGPVSLGDIVSSVGGLVLPPVLNALIGHRTDAGSTLLKRTGQAAFDTTSALDLLTANLVDESKLAVFAADPAGRLLARLPQLANAAVAAIVDALDSTGSVVQVTSALDAVSLAFGSTASVTLHTTLGAPAVSVTAAVNVAGIGPVVIDELRLDALGVSVSAHVGPGELDVAGATLRPLFVVQVGPAVGATGRLVGIGLASSDTTSVQFRWALDATAPTVVVVTSTTTGEATDDDPLLVAGQLAAIAAALGISIALPQLDTLLDTPVAGVKPGDILQGVVFTDASGSRSVDAAALTDLLDADKLLVRLERAAWNLATSGLTLTIDGTGEVGLVAMPLTGTRKQIGVRVGLTPGTRLTLLDSDLRVDLEVDSTWIKPAPVGDGISIFAISGDPAAPHFGFRLEPGLVVAGLGIRVLKSSGPLLDLGGVSIDAIALHTYGEVGATGVGGGVRVKLDGLAVAPGGSGGTNAVANSIMSDAGSAGQANRPVLAPSLAIQKHPGATGPSVSLGLGDPPGPWWVLVQRQLGPLYIDRVGLDTAEADGRIERIALLFDGSVSLFGLTATVDRLSLTWLGGDPFELSQWAVDVAGFAISADLSGIALAGGLLKTDYDGEAAYVGMLLGRFGIYGLSVFGGYTTTAGDPSFFVFGAVTAPIGGPPAFFLTGLGGGLGINRALKVPADLSTFGDYPFIQALDPAASPPTDPMAELKSLSTYFPPQSGTFWFAAGISFTSFALVDGVAVVSVAFGNGLEINLFGLARMALPRPEAALVSIEIGLLARFSTEEGVFSIQGQLTDNSWLLYPEVRLTGGFAFAVWWKGALAGQFVLTLGGYHPDFSRDGYPIVPRLGLTWQVTNDISVKGGSYFALTSEALMAGTDVEVVANFGWAWARLAFGAHGIVYFDPFWFEVRAYVEISAGVKIKTWLGTISFSISIGAHVTVWGPEFSGKAKFGVGPCSLTVAFGSQRTVEPETLLWDAFIGKYLEDAGGAARALSAITGRGTLPASTGGAVGAPTSDGTVGRPYEVFAEFEITFVTSIPASSVRAALDAIVTVAPTRSDAAIISLGLAPMAAAGLTSVLNLSLESLNAATGTWNFEHAKLSQLAANLRLAVPSAAGSALLTDAFPLGVWGEPAAQGLPAPALPTGDVVTAAKGVRLVAEAIVPPQTGPEIDYYRTENGWKPLPLQATATGRGAVLNTASGFERAPVSVAAALELAAAELFAIIDRQVPRGVVATRPRSNLAAASFVGERTAPPLFGTLADGMARTNRANTTGSKLPPKVKPTYAGPRLPNVLAHLTAGTAVAPALARTSVADASIARRPAPTLASTRARTATHLPVKLVRTAAPGAGGRTVVAPVVPFTDAPVTARAHVPALAGADLSHLVGGIGAPETPGAAAGGSTPIQPGDVVVLHAPDAAADTDGERRPYVDLDGPARVVMLRGDGSPMFDGIQTGRVAVPAHARLIAVQAGRSGAGDGFAGWHTTSRLASIGANTAIGPSCQVMVERGNVGPVIGWIRGGDLVRDAAVITTRFAVPVTVIALVLADATPDRVDDIGLHLTGGTIVADATGRSIPPAVVLSGSTAVLVYRVVPDPGRNIAVSVRSGGSWSLAGVLGGNAAADDVIALASTGGPEALSARLLAPTGDRPVRIEWIAAPIPPAPRAQRPAAKRSARTARRQS
jgi:large repetitive protein